MDWSQELMKAVADGDEVTAARVAAEALGSGTGALDVLRSGALPGIDKAARLWHEGEYFLPDVILATEAFNDVMEIVRPALEGQPDVTRGLVVIGSVEGDAHDLGKNIVVALLRSAMYEVVDLGVDVPTATFVETVRSRRPAVLGLGAYMTTTMRGMEDVMDALKAEGLRGSIKVVIGGVAVTAEYAEKIGADGYGADAVEAVALVDALLGES
jgi:5-methyltetrahydrofolate--homocysteine methyltransferase